MNDPTVVTIRGIQRGSKPEAFGLAAVAPVIQERPI
jgi:hypothetical protein